MVDNGNDFVYFINSQGKRAVLSSPENRNYWELRGRSGFTAPELEIFSEKMAAGQTIYFGKALAPRTLKMRMVCVGETTAERDKVFFEMVDTLIDLGGSGEGKLYVRKSNGATVYINCVYSAGMSIVEQYKRIHLFTLEFYAADPLFYSRQIHPFTEISSSPYSITINNPYDTPMYVSMLCGLISSSWSIEGVLTNSATGKKITFNRSNFESSQMYFSLNPTQPALYLTNSAGERTSASYVVDWLATDTDFCIVPGENTITSTLHWPGPGANVSEFYFDAAFLGA